MKAETADISIIVPIYKIKEEHLRACIESLIGQTHKNIEIFLVDDGSPDECGAICDEYAGQDDRIRVIHQQNRGVSVARNAGIEAAVGRYLIFVDGDDWLEVDCCERMLREIEQRGVDIVFIKQCREYERGTKYLPDAPSIGITKEKLKIVQLYTLRGENCYGFDARAPWGKIIKSEIIKKNHLEYIEGIRKSQDVLFNLYLYEVAESAYFINYIGYHYRINDYSIDHRYNPDMPEIIKEMFKEVELFIHKLHYKDPLYENAFGIRCIKMIGLIETTYFCHKESKLTRKEIIQISENYLKDVSIYTDKCRMKDFHRLTDKVRYIVEKYRLLNLYYCMIQLVKRLGIYQ